MYSQGKSCRLYLQYYLHMKKNFSKNNSDIVNNY